MSLIRTRIALALSAAIVTMTVAPGSALASPSEAPSPAGITVGVDSIPLTASVTGQKGITVHGSRRAARKDPTVVYSVRVRDIGRGRLIRAIGSVEPAYCVGSDIKGTDHLGSPCQRLAGDHVPNPHYPIEIEAQIYGAHSQQQPRSPSTRALNGADARVRCTFDRHHCPLTVVSDRTPVGPAKRFINLAVFAWTRSRARQQPDRLDLDCFEIGRRCETSVATNGPVAGHPGQRVQQPGQLGVISYGHGYDTGSAATASSTRVDGADVAVSVSRAFEGGTVVHSARLDGLEPGDVIEASGVADLTGDGFDHLAGSHWVLARDPQAVAAQSGTPDRYLSALNGVNCLGAEGVLTDYLSGYCSATREPPTLPLGQTALGVVGRGAPSTMYLNYVVLASDGTVPDDRTPSAHVDGVSVDVSCSPVPRAAAVPGCAFTTP
jgi:hypothetical protein